MNHFDRIEPELCAGIPGASTSNGRTCWNEATTGDLCEECKREIAQHAND